MSAGNNLAGAASTKATDWHSIDWIAMQRNVRRLQARIVKATLEGRRGKVKALQRLLTHSFSGKALAVLRVTENSGQISPGVDGVRWNTPDKKTEALHALRQRGYQPLPLKRVYIPKSNDTLRPLSIPTMKDRAMQALYLLAVDPVAETQADPHSYGFRKERSCHDALRHCHTLLSGCYAPDWVLEGDIKSCFDRISHDWLLGHVLMDKAMLSQWLKAGYLYRNTFHQTTEGTPQGGVISPVLANWALDGLQQHLADNIPAFGPKGQRSKVHLVRYADDFIISGYSQELLRKEVLPKVAKFLKPRGLELSVEKTLITHKKKGFDFLSQTVRKYGEKVLTRPSNKSTKRFRTKIRELLKSSQHVSPGDLIIALNQQIVGWGLYHRHAASKQTFAKLDHYVFWQVWRWCKRRHPKLSSREVRRRYFIEHEGRQWVFTGEVRQGRRGSRGVYLQRLMDISIRRHVKIRGEANPYDPEYEEYFELRRQEKMDQCLEGRGVLQSLWEQQEGRCVRCRGALTEDRGWQLHHRVWRVHGGDDSITNLELLHPNCHRQIHARRDQTEVAASTGDV